MYNVYVHIYLLFSFHLLFEWIQNQNFIEKMLTVATQPICLHPDRDDLIVGKRATIIGWGKLSHLSRQSYMQFLEVPLTPWEQCAKIYSSTGALESPKSIGMQ